MNRTPKKPYRDEDLDRLLESVFWQIVARDKRHGRRLIERLMKQLDEKAVAKQTQPAFTVVK